MMILDVDVKTSTGEGEAKFNFGLGVSLEGFPNWSRTTDNNHV